MLKYIPRSIHLYVADVCYTWKKKPDGSTCGIAYEPDSDLPVIYSLPTIRSDIGLHDDGLC